MSNWRGTWASGTAYAAGDSVTYGGAPYYCLIANTGHAPGTDADWAVMDSFTGPGAVVDHVTVTGTAATGQVITATSASAANWQTPAAGLALDSTAGDIKALGTQSAGSASTAAKGDHVHPTTGVVLTSSLPLAIASGGTNATTGAGALTSLGAAALAGATFTGWEAPAVVALTDAATITVNAASGNDQRVTLGGNRTLGAPSNPVDGQQILFQVTQDGTGSRTLAYTSGAGGYSFSAQLPSPTLSIAAGAVDLLKFVYNLTKNRWLFIAYLGGF